MVELINSCNEMPRCAETVIPLGPSAPGELETTEETHPHPGQPPSDVSSIKQNVSCKIPSFRYAMM